MGDETDQAKSLLGGQQPPEPEEQVDHVKEQVDDVKEQVDEKMGPGERLGDLTDEGKHSPPQT
jgi:hypothetical protein